MDRMRERLRGEEAAAAAAGNNPTGEYDEEEEVQRAMNQSRAEEEYGQSVHREEVHMSMEGVVVLVVVVRWG
jgi:hypothetical protein